MCEYVLKKYSIFGIFSLVFGLLSIVVTVIIVLLLDQIIGGTFNRNIAFFVNALNFFSIIEIIVKATGFLLGLLGLFKKNTKKNISVIGLTVNIATIIWSLFIIYG